MREFVSRNPYNGECLARIPGQDQPQLEKVLQAVHRATPAWAETPFSARADLMSRLAQHLRENERPLATLISQEMGKLIGEARAEVNKCAQVCEYYAQHAADMLAEEIIPSDAGRSYVAYEPVGTVLAIMPWNFPFWQVFRFAAPAMMAGNTALLKHASNVPQCALKLEQLFLEAGFPDHVFRSLMIPADMVNAVIEDQRVHAVTLTGSESAGRAVASCAGHALKKSVLELGGSDAFIVLPDAELDQAVATAVTTRFLNAGQSCIAGKRFIVTEPVADEFVARFRDAINALRTGDPMKDATTLAPMARPDLRDELHHQVQRSIEQGAKAIAGCTPATDSHAAYQASLLDHVRPGMVAADEELFGPVASVIRVRSAEEAVAVANDSRFGLGGSIWTEDIAQGERLARHIQSGAVFINGLVKSDPRLPFGGIKDSGYGRELSHHGLHEFVNAKTVWIR